MKFFLAFLTAFFIWSTVGLAQTSEEEFLYANLGYKEQLLKGLDDKKGYHWKPLTEYNFTDKKGMIGKKTYRGKFLFEGLYREGEEHPCAIVAIYLPEHTLEKKQGTFICLPHPESPQDVIGKAKEYFEDEVKFNSDELIAYSMALSKLAMHLGQGNF